MHPTFDWSRGPMDLAAARAAGIDFFTHKATEGTSTKHTHYGEALGRARAAGVPFLGAYHVVRSGPAIAAQVDYLLAYADAATPWWPTFDGWFWQCDLEKWSYDQVSAQRGVDFCAALAERTNRAVLLYAPRWAYGDGIGGAAPLWASDYVTGTGTPQALYTRAGGDTSSRWNAYSGRTPVILQYSSSATIGRQPGCDANAFRGTVADFASLIGGDDMSFTDDDRAMLAQLNAIARADRWAWVTDRDGFLAAGGAVAAWDYGGGMGDNVAAQQRAQLVAAAAADEQRDRVMLAAIQALTVATGADPKPILDAIAAARGETHDLVLALQQQVATLQAKLAAAAAAEAGALGGK